MLGTISVNAHFSFTRDFVSPGPAPYPDGYWFRFITKKPSPADHDFRDTSRLLPDAQWSEDLHQENEKHALSIRAHILETTLKAAEHYLAEY